MIWFVVVFLFVLGWIVWWLSCCVGVRGSGGLGCSGIELRVWEVCWEIDWRISCIGGEVGWRDD